MSDKIVKLNEKGHRIGDSHPRAVLSDHEVDLLLELLIARDDLLEAMNGQRQAVIDAALHEEQLSYTQLSIKFEIHRQAVAKIARGERRCQTPSSYRHPVPMKRKP